MAVIVSDATPLNYLVEIGAADVLPQLYGRVIIPPAVRAELNHAKTPKALREWLSKSPAWLEVVAPSIIPPAALTELYEWEGTINGATNWHHSGTMN